MGTTDSTTGLSQNDSRRRVTRTAIVANWNGVGSASKVLSDNVGLAQHQVWWTSTGATAGTMTVFVRAAKSAFFVPIGTINLATVPNGELMFAALIDDVMFQIAGLTGTFSMDAGINSVGIDFTPTGNRSLVDRRRFQVMEVASGWNGASAITISAPDHAGFAQHQLAIAGGAGSVKLRARPVDAGAFVDITPDVAAVSAGGALVLFPGMYDAFQLVPVGTVSGSISAQVISVGQEMFLPVTPWQVNAGLGYIPADDSKVVHIAGAETVTGVKTFTNSVFLGGNTYNSPIYTIINTVAGNNRGIAFQTAGLNRWIVATDNSAESGSNAGSNLVINRFNDAGAFVDTPVSINRATGIITLNDSVSLGTGVQINLPNSSTFAQSAGGGYIKTGSNGGFFVGAGAAANAFAILDSAGTQRVFYDNNGVQSLAQIGGYFGGTGGPTGSASSWAAVNNLFFGANAEYASSSSWKSQYATTPPIIMGLTGGALAVYPATSAAPTAGGQAITFPVTAPFRVETTGEAVQQLTGSGQSGGYRSVNSNIGVFWRFDGSTYYLLKTATGSPLGSWDGNRPFAWNVGGGISSDQTWTFNNTAFNAYHNFTGTGTNGAGFWLNGQGGTTPNKLIRAFNGVLQFVNSANSVVLMTLADFTTAGSLTMTGGVYPSADNAYPVGQASARWSVIYSATGTINTCDQREKTGITSNTLGLDFVNSLPVSMFKYLVKHNEVTPMLDADGKAVLDSNGEFQSVVTPIPGVRTHIGTMAQAVVTALTNAGIDPSTMGMWSLDVPTDPTSRQGLRENELMWVLWTAVQQLSAKVVSMQSDITAIKAKLGM